MAAAPAIRVFVVNEHQMVRDGLCKLVEAEPDLELAGASGRGRDLLERLATERWDVVILDLALRDIGGIELLRRIRLAAPDLAVIVISSYREAVFGPRILRHGANAYFSKERSPAELLEAIRTLARGGSYTGASAAARARAGATPIELLSPREYQLFLLVMQGQAPGEIARKLEIAPATVSSHLAQIREKLGVRTNGEMIEFGYRTGLST